MSIELYDKHVFDVVPVPPVDAVVYDFLLLTPMQREWVYRRIDYCIIRCRLEDFKSVEPDKSRGGTHLVSYLAHICLVAGGVFGDETKTCGTEINRTILSALRGRANIPRGCPRWATAVPAYAYMGHLSAMMNDNSVVEDLNHFLLYGSQYSARYVREKLESYFNRTQRINEYYDSQAMEAEFAKQFEDADEEEL